MNTLVNICRALVARVALPANQVIERLADQDFSTAVFKAIPSARWLDSGRVIRGADQVYLAENIEGVELFSSMASTAKAAERPVEAVYRRINGRLFGFQEHSYCFDKHWTDVDAFVASTVRRGDWMVETLEEGVELIHRVH